MSVFHIHKRELPFVQIDKQLVGDKRLSLKAKGIMLYLLSKPDNWKVYEVDIANNNADKICSVRSGVKELIQHGYISREKVRDSKKRFTGYIYNVYEIPVELTNITVMRFSDNGKSNTTNNELNNNSEPHFVSAGKVNGKEVFVAHNEEQYNKLIKARGMN